MDDLRPVLSLRPRPGFTLVETIVAIGIFSLVIAGTMGFIMQQSAFESVEMRETVSQGLIRRGINLAVFELEECRPVAITQDGRTFEYTLPLRDAATGQMKVSTATSKPFYGIREDGGKEYDATDSVKKYNFYVMHARIRTLRENGVLVRPDPQDPRERLVESALNMDFNGDGDKSDIVEGVSEATVNSDLNNDGDIQDYYVYFDLELSRMDNTVYTRQLGGPFAVLKDNAGKDGKIFSLEAEPIAPPTETRVDLFDSRSKTFLMVYDQTSNVLTDLNQNGKWDASIIILIMYVDLGSPANLLKVARTKVFMRNTD